MATPINAPMAGEIWHLSIEDLFAPVQEAPRLGGDGPFVINLSASTAPISVPTKSFSSSVNSHVYQIQVTEDGRTRYRLRVGPFVTEDEADAMLAEVRDTYPSALTATATAADLRVIGNMQAKIDSRQSVTLKASGAHGPTEKAVLEKEIPETEVLAVLERAVPQKIAAEKAAPQKVVAEKVAPPQSNAEIAIDIAWPTPELVVPASRPLRAATTATIAAAPTVEIPPAAMPPLELSPEWALPELDTPLPKVHTARPVAKSSAPTAAAPRATASLAPLLTDVVVPANRPPAPKAVAPIPVAIAAPVLTQAVAPSAKARAPVVPAAKIPAPKPSVPSAAAPIPRAPIAVAPIVPAAIAIAAPAPAPAAVQPPAPQPAAPTMKNSAPKIVAPIAAAPSAPPKPSAPLTPSAPPKAAKPSPVLTQSVASPPKASAPKLRASAIKPMAARLTSLQHVVAATAPVPAVREVKKLDQPLESLESTQTMRALTPVELEDDETSRWFVIQLALADHAFDPDAVPNLDIFSEYRLYSVAGLDQGQVVHALRLGFFREEVGAVAVASYLAAYWDKPTIKRVSLAERERFADQRVEARKDIGATGRHAVIEITDELVARRKRTFKSSASTKTSNRPI